MSEDILSKRNKWLNFYEPTQHEAALCRELKKRIDRQSRELLMNGDWMDLESKHVTTAPKQDTKIDKEALLAAIERATNWSTPKSDHSWDALGGLWKISGAGILPVNPRRVRKPKPKPSRAKDLLLAREEDKQIKKASHFDPGKRMPAYATRHLANLERDRLLKEAKARSIAKKEKKRKERRESQQGYGSWA